MKNLFILAGVFALLLTNSCCTNHKPETVLLNKEWKFNTGDDLKWADPLFSDTAWGIINPHEIWESQGFKGYNGFAWYRTRIVIPSSLKNKALPNDSIQIFLGRIDDCDQVFLNGKLIGENARNISGTQKNGDDFIKEQGRWNLDRKYKLAQNAPEILWDKENVIAIRCFDQGGAGGVFGKPFEIVLTGLQDYLQIDFETHPFTITSDTVVSKTFTIVNLTGSDTFQGELLVEAILCRNKTKLFSQKTQLQSLPKSNTDLTFTFTKQPTEPALFRVTFVQSGSGKKMVATAEVPYLLTPKTPAIPKINGAKVFGVRPWSPFLYKVAATGEPPLRYSAADLPDGLSINPDNGIITGSMKKKGEYIVKLTVENHLGYAERDFKIVVGDLISLTPPMGWNSWNCWGLSVSDQKVRQSANAMKSSGLIDHGWTYINIDDGWEDTHDKNGNILTNAKFPNMPALCNYIHALGLKAGIYSSPGTRTCGGYEGSYGFEAKDAANYASWGIDYLKYDWCSYGNIAPDPNLDQLKKPYREMRHALRKANRDIHYSLCQYGMGEVWKWGAEVDGNSWRTTGDIEDTWESLSSIGFSQSKCSPWSAPGRWNDPDMLIVGMVGWGPSLHYTRLTPSEQYTHITLWSLLASPLLIGCDLDQLDPFTLNLLTNDEVLAVNQDPLGKQAIQIHKTEEFEVWVRDLADGSKAVGLFNKSEKPINIPVEMADFQASGKWNLRDLWTQTDLGKVRNHFEMNTRPHGARMIILSK